MSQLIEEAFQATHPIFDSPTQNIAIQAAIDDMLVEGNMLEKLALSSIEPIVVLPVLPSNALDELFCRFGFRPNSRANLIRQGLFPRGAAIRGRAMSTSLYPSLALDLLALLSRERGRENELTTRLHEEINALIDTTLFTEVAGSLTKRLPVGQPLTLTSISRLFAPVVNLTQSSSMVGTSLKFNWFNQLDYQSQQNWYQLALLQHQVRLLFFGSISPCLLGETAPALLEILTGWVEGEGHSPEGYSKVVFSHSAFEGELAYWEEEQLKKQTLSWLGCEWPDAPLSRLQATLDQHDSRLVFYLPGLHPPVNHLIRMAGTKLLEKHVTNTPITIVPGFERPFDPENPQGMAELLADLALENEG